MATVKNTIILNDRMTPVLRSIIKSLNSAVTALASVDNMSDKAFDGVRRDVQAASAAVDALEKEMIQLEKPIRETRSGFSTWQSAIVTANQGLQLIQSTMASISKVTSFADQQTMLTSRLTLMTGDAEAALALEKEIMASANRSRASYTATADSIAQMGMMASEAFTKNGALDTKELIAFTESINKQLVMSGVAGTTGADAALYQLTQAMSSGVLRGDELRSVMEQAPVIADTIAKYMGVSKGEMRELAFEGKVTSDIVKNAMLSALEDTNDKFGDMPVTFGQAMTQLKNKAIEESKPLVEQFSKFIQSDAFQSAFSFVMQTLPQIMSYIQSLIDKFDKLGNSQGVQRFVTDLNYVVGVLGWIFGLVVDVAVFILDNWSLISPVIWGIVAGLIAYGIYLGIVKVGEIAIAVAKGVVMLASYAKAAATRTEASATAQATAAQWGLNTALLASPITWIILILIALITLIFLIVAAVNKATGSTTSAIGIIVGALAVAGAFIWDLFLGLFELVLGILSFLINPILAFVNFFGNVFNDPIGAIIHLFADLADNVLGVIESIASALDFVFGSNMASTVSNWRNDLRSMADIKAKEYGNGEYEKVTDLINLSVDDLGLKRWDYGDAWNTGYDAGTGVQESISDFVGGFDLDSIKNLAEDTAANTGNLSDLGSGGGGGLNVQGEVSITDEDIKLLKDVAAAEWVNKYTTLRPEMNVTFGDVHETADAEQLLDKIETMVEEAYASALVGG